MNKDVLLLKQMLESESFDESVMREILSHYKDHPAIIPCSVLAGAKIIRSSTNDTKEFHNDISRLNYPPEKYARTDRASLKGKPMFYATVFTTAVKDNAYPRIFSAMETTEILRDFQIEGRAFTTQSLWLSDRDFHLFAFPFSKKYKKPCAEITYQRKAWEQYFTDHWSEDYIQFSEYMGDLMAEKAHSCLYDITANAINYILYESDVASEFDGVMYPSFWGDGQGMNICLKKETVDECVHFKGASVQCIDKHVGESSIICVADSYQLPDGKLRWIPTQFAISLLENAYGIDNLVKQGAIVIETAKR